MTESPLPPADQVEIAPVPVPQPSPKTNTIQRSFAMLRSTASRRDSWALFDQSIISGSNFLTNILLARWLGLREFGVYTLAWTAVLFLNSIQISAIIAPLMSVGPKIEKQERPGYYAAVIFQQVVFAVFCFLLLLFGTGVVAHLLHAPSIVLLRWPLAWCVLAYQLQDFIRRYFFVVSRPRLAVMTDSISYIGQIVLLLVLLRWGKIGVAGALEVIAGTSAIAAVAGLPFLETLRWEKAALGRVLHRHWVSSKWLIGASLMQWTSGNLFVLAAPAVYGPSAAGVLRIAQNLMGVTHIWLQGLENTVPVRAARRLHEAGVRGLRHYILEVAALWGGLTLAFAAVVSIAPGFLLRILYGPTYANYGYVLRWYALLYVLIFLGLPLRSGLRALEHTRPIFISYTAMTAFAALFAFPFAKFFGLSGAMLGLIGTQIIFQSVMAFSLRARLAERS